MFWQYPVNRHLSRLNDIRLQELSVERACWYWAALSFAATHLSRHLVFCLQKISLDGSESRIFDLFQFLHFLICLFWFLLFIMLVVFIVCFLFFFLFEWLLLDYRFFHEISFFIFWIFFFFCFLLVCFYWKNFLLFSFIHFFFLLLSGLSKLNSFVHFSFLWCLEIEWTEPILTLGQMQETDEKWIYFINPLSKQCLLALKISVHNERFILKFNIM